MDSNIKPKLCFHILSIFLLIIPLSITQSNQNASSWYEKCNLFGQIPFDLNISVEEGEILQIQLDDYIRGNLLHYSLNFYEDQEFCKYVSLQEQYVIKKNIQYGLQKPQFLHKDPFISSTLIVDVNEESQFLFFLDRNFQLFYYDITHIQSEILEYKTNIQLLTSKVNGTCQNLRTLSEFNPSVTTLILACSSIVETQQSNYIGRNIYENTKFNQTQLIVVIENFQDLKEENVKYYTVSSKTPLPNLDYEIFHFKDAYLNEERDEMIREEIFIIFIDEDQRNANISLLQFDEENKQVTLTNHRQLQFLDVLDLPEVKYENLQADSIGEINIKDFDVINKDCGIVAIVDQNHGLFIKQYIPEDPSFYPNCKRLQENEIPINTFIQKTGLNSVYFNNNDPNSLFVSISFPQKTLEIDISDLINPFVKKEYSINGDDYHYISSQTVVSNGEYLVSALLEMDSQNQILRFYKRHASQEYYAQYQIQIKDQFKSNFFEFPSYYMNQLLYRDEKNLNVSIIKPSILQIDFTDQRTEFDIWEPKRINGHLNISNNLGYSAIQIFNISLIPTDQYEFLIKNQVSDPLYACGDPQFSYSLDNILSGPDFKFQIEGTPYFEVKNRGPKSEVKSKNLNLTYCNYTIMDSMLTQKQEITHFLICINTNEGMIQMCRIDSIIDKKQQLINCDQVFHLDDAEIVDIYYNDQEFILMVVSNSFDPINKNESSDNYSIFYDMHFFEVGDQLFWKKIQSKGNLGQYKNLQISNYNSYTNQGVIVQNFRKTDKIGEKIVINTFSIDTIEYSTDMLAEFEFDYNYEKDESVKRVVLSHFNFIWILFSNNTISTYQYSYCPVTKKYTLKKVQKVLFNLQEDQSHPEQILNNDKAEYDSSSIKLLSFDLTDKTSCLVLYFENNQTFIYSINTFYTIEYKMKLPKYAWIKDSFYTFFDIKGQQPQILRVFKDNYLILLAELNMYETDILQEDRYQFLVYDISKPQHESYLFSVNSDLLSLELMNPIIHLTTINDDGVLSIFNENKINLINLDFQARIIVNKHKRDELYDACYNLNRLGNFVNFTIQSRSDISYIGYIAPHFKVSLKALNSGLIIQKNYAEDLQEQEVNITMSYSKDISYSSSSSSSQSDQENKFINNNIVLNDIFKGKNMNFTIRCNLGSDSCNDQIQDFYTPNLENNLIEFVTSQREVIRSFSFDQYLFLVDSAVKLNLMKIVKTDSQNDNKANKQSLVYIDYLCQVRTFGCFIKEFAKMFDINYGVMKVDRPNATHNLLVIQCKDDNFTIQQIKFSSIIFMKDFFSNYQESKDRLVIDYETQWDTSNYANFTRTSIKVGKDLFQIMKINTTYIIKAGLILSDALIIPLNQNNTKSTVYQKKYKNAQQTSFTQFFYLALVFDNPDSFTNYLEIYEFALTRDDYSVPFLKRKQTNATLSNMKSFNSDTVGMSSFKAKRIMISKNQRLLFVSLDWIGIGIIDLEFQKLTYLLDLSRFDGKSVLMYDPSLLVFGMIQESEQTWHFIYNRGIIEATFNLTQLTEEIPYIEQVNYITSYSMTFIEAQMYQKITELVQCRYGYAFLNTKYINEDLFETYLGFINFLQDRNSKYMYEVHLIQNIDCNSLNIVNDVNFENEANNIKRLNMTMICGTYFYTVSLSIYPHLKIDFKKTAVQIQGSSIEQYVNFTDYGGKSVLNINVKAHNGLTEENTPIKLTVDNPTFQSYYTFNVIVNISLMIFLSLTLTGIMLMSSPNQDKENKNIRRNGKDRQFRQQTSRTTITASNYTRGETRTQNQSEFKSTIDIIESGSLVSSSISATGQ